MQDSRQKRHRSIVLGSLVLVGILFGNLHGALDTDNLLRKLD